MPVRGAGLSGLARHHLATRTRSGTEWRPASVRVMRELRKLVSKQRLRGDAWRVDQVYWSPRCSEPLQ
jgi:hypothetical protein